MSKTPKEIVESINTEYYIPVIQRRFVWETEQISMLFDSIMREFPIGQMLLKKSDKEIVNKNPTYNFITNYVVDEIKDIENASYRNIKSKKIESNPVKLVFDGQQRLTALNIGLKGSIYERENKYSQKKSENYTQKFFCINAISNPEKSINNSESFNQAKGGDAPMYEFAFKKKDEIGKKIKNENKEKFWYKVNNILDEDDILNIDIDTPDSLTEKQKNYINKNLQRLYQTIHNNNCIDLKEVDKDKSKEDMLEIFVRMNRSGTQISDTDTAISILTYRWQEDTNKEDLIARDKIEDFKYELNSRFDDNKTPITDDMILQGAMVCSNTKSDIIEAPRINIDKFTDKDNNLSDIIKEIWEDGTYKKAMKKYINLLREFGIPSSKIRKSIFMCPILLFIYNNKNKPVFDKSSKIGLKNRQRILYWICSTPVLGITSNATMKISKEVMTVIDEDNSNEFPLSEIEKALSPKLSIRFKPDTIQAKDIHRDFYDKNHSIYLNMLISLENISKHNSKQDKNYHQDHIFPKSKLDNSVDKNRLGNIQYIPHDVNTEKQDMDFSDWIESRTDNYKKEYFIPMNNKLYEYKSYENFTKNRENKISRHLADISETLIDSESAWRR